ncbi:ABC transporter substrate-binding protein [Rhizobium oryzicola]|uniref:ABC transporter substrate-binding protein n=1 Tax=Rhizobium oryzicola TaxID=1232668 RepID=A0ABT8SVX2_9HYPH|nr:ABC transporter substrate-binding protein [Rhizobium oryzicola]MDO1582594.1 ABC transporter substrate-binding protein [Rhizobium oryzicola]
MLSFSPLFDRRRFMQLAAGGVLATASAKEVFAQSKKQLRIAYGAIGADRHPFQLSITPDWDINALVFDSLISLNSNGEPVAGTATAKIERPSPVTIRLTLKPGIQFSNGEPLGAADVKTSMETYLRPEVLNSYLYTPWLERVEIVDDLTVDLISKRPFRIALGYMAYQSFIIPRTATDLQQFSRAPIGSGPFIIAETESSNRILLRRNQKYTRKQPGFEEILLRKIPEDSTRVAALLAKEVDFASSVRVEDVQAIRSMGGSIDELSTLRMMFVRFNMSFDSPLRDVRVRKAINHAVDRVAIQEAFYGGRGAIAKAPVASGTRFFAEGLEPYSFDLAKARKLMAEAGHSSGFSMKLATPMGRYYRDREIAEAIAGQVQQIGVNLEIVPMEWATYLQRVRTEWQTTGKEYGLSLMAWGNPTQDADFGVIPFDTVSNAWNIQGYKNERVQELMTLGRTEFDPTKLKAIYDELQSRIWDDAPWLFLFEMPIINGMSGNLSGVRQNRTETMDWINAQPAK